MRQFYEPILQPLADLDDPLCFQGTDLGFEYVRILSRAEAPIRAHVMECDESDLLPFLTPPAMTAHKPHHVMGIVNVTPDSFSDGGQFMDAPNAIAHARKLVEAGADILDFGAESTKPGAEPVPLHEELRRLEEVFEALDSFGVATSIDTRKAAIADEAIGMGASMINDVSAMSFDPAMIDVLASSDVNMCFMHAQGDPKTMQDNPQYDDVVLGVYEYLETQIERAENVGIDRSRIAIDPGLGFGKTLEHNLTLIRHMAVFHGLGCPLLVGASRKRMIKEIGGGEAGERLGGSLSIALDLARKGVQIIRVHEVFETVQALKLQTRLMRNSDGA